MSNSMNLNLPTVSTTPGPTWASNINTALTTVAEHDHSSGNGVKITPAGINIIADLAFQGNNVTGLRSARLDSQGAIVNGASDLGCLVNVNGDIWWVNNAGTGVQITTGGAINIASVGTIGGDYGQPGVPASVAYSDTTKTFTFLQDSGEGAKLFSGTINIANEAASSLSVSIGADAATSSYALVLPIAAPGNDTVMSFDSTGQATFRTITGTTGEVTVASSGTTHQVSLPLTVTKGITFSGANTFSGNTSGRGILPLGAVIATMPHLTGAYSCTATTAADANGFVQCAGQTLVDATSPMNGAVIPNINNDVFLMGNATSGTAGGANTKTLSTSELPSHTHTINHGHANTFGLTGTTSFASTGHTHDMSHAHQWSWTDSSSNNYSYYSPQPAVATFTTASGTFIGSGSGVTSGTSSFPDNLRADAARAFFTAGAIDASSNLISNTGSPSASASVGFTGAVTDHSGSSGSVGSGSSFDIRPSYISARYVMRVK